MSPAHVLEPTYQNLKKGLMQGFWRPGERLEALRLADEFGVSMTPVRDSLNRLVGEALVDMNPGDGYRVPRIGEKTLRDMLDVNLMLLDYALHHQGRGASAPAATNTAKDYAERVAAVFNHIATRAANTVLTETLKSLGERMHAIRRWEPQLFPDCLQELEGIENSVTADAKDTIIRLRDYHRHRHNCIADLIEFGQS